MQIEYKSNMYLYNKVGAIYRLDGWGVFKIPSLHCYENGVDVTLAELSKITGIQDYKQLLNMYYRPFYLQLDDEVTYNGFPYKVGDFVKTNYSKEGLGLKLIDSWYAGIVITKEKLLVDEKIKLEKGYLSGE